MFGRSGRSLITKANKVVAHFPEQIRHERWAQIQPLVYAALV